MSAIELQRKLMGDTPRNAIFREALRQVIVPGKTTVADIGAGTGFLSFLAIQLGAKSAALYEHGDVLGLARKLATENGIKRLTFVQAHSTQVPSPVRADVVVSETLGNYAYEEHILEVMADAKRFLKPGGTLLPQKIRQYVCPVTDDRLAREIDVWGGVGHDLTFRAAREVTLQNMFVKTLAPKELLGGGKDAQRWDEADLREKNASVREGTARWTLRDPAVVSGLALWWECDVLDGLTLSTSPLAPQTHWEQIYLPLLQPLTLPGGSTLLLTLHSDTRWKTGVNLRWTVAATGPDGREIGRQELDMKKGFLA